MFIYHTLGLQVLNTLAIISCGVVAQLSPATTTGKPHQELMLELETHGVIPDCLDKTPPHELHVKFLEKVAADYGNALSIKSVKFAPYLIKYPVKNETFYTVMMLGLDEPTRETPTQREWLHYLVANVPGLTIYQGDTIASWIQPLPEMGTGFHRYVFLVYEQKAKTSFTERRLGDIRSDKNRAGFSHKRFSEKYEFGEPLAVNFFHCIGPFNTSVTPYPDDKVPEPTENYFQMAEEEEAKKNPTSTTVKP